jgi:hypothetical protein
MRCPKVAGVLVEESEDRLVELIEAGLTTALGGDVGTVHDEVRLGGR